VRQRQRRKQKPTTAASELAAAIAAADASIARAKAALAKKLENSNEAKAARAMELAYRRVVEATAAEAERVRQRDRVPPAPSGAQPKALLPKPSGDRPRTQPLPAYTRREVERVIEASQALRADDKRWSVRALHDVCRVTRRKIEAMRDKRALPSDVVAALESRRRK
jgi:hypothetical protein